MMGAGRCGKDMKPADVDVRDWPLGKNTVIGEMPGAGRMCVGSDCLRRILVAPVSAIAYAARREAVAGYEFPFFKTVLH